MKTLTIACWKDLTNLAEEFTVGSASVAGENWIFRGVENEAYDLTPKTGRPGTWKKWPSGDPGIFDPEVEIAAINYFARQARPHEKIEPKSFLEWLALAQHHGMPTRLLDWSESVFVAAYFALKAGGFVLVDRKWERRDAAIYGMPCPKTGDDPEKSSDDVVAVFSRHVSPRITAQNGLFTWHRDPTKAYTSDQVRKWIIPSKVCFTLKVILSKAGFN
jgi:hypothetical protein